MRLLSSSEYENRLIGWEQTGPSVRSPATEFAYDGLGRLRTRWEYLGNGSDYVLQSTTSYFYDSMRVIQERDGDNNPQVSYTRGIDLSGTLEGAGGIGGLLARSAGYTCGDSTLTVTITNGSAEDCTFWIYSDAGTNVDGGTVAAGSSAEFSFTGVAGVSYTIYGTDSRFHALSIGNTWTPTLDHHHLILDEDPEEYSTFDDGGILCGASGTWRRHDYYFADGNGNAGTLVDANQTVSANYQYDPFGNITAQSGVMADANVYRFSSKELHVASGMYYYGYRSYAPLLQRWINQDPVAEAGGMNLFEFVRNDGLNRIDPWGEDAVAPPTAPPTPAPPVTVPRPMPPVEVPPVAGPGLGPRILGGLCRCLSRATPYLWLLCLSGDRAHPDPAPPPPAQTTCILSPVSPPGVCVYLCRHTGNPADNQVARRAPGPNGCPDTITVRNPYR